ncbi:unnamed protein product [Microthlaspi erraticum]|uniref:Acid phosphatase n=1 Tax=Microthlaspi erraticum TaxID=1685480 RepID=A0A6D2IHF5_9BRAS|nr:unnamed protein product [Microthlaspi erraticum]
MAFSRSSSISFFILALFALFINPTISSRVSSFIQLPVSTVESRPSVASYCEGWRLAVETNNAGSWTVVPSKCVSSLETYYNRGQFDKDYNVVANYALSYAKTIQLAGDGKDAWVFDVDETLLSNLEYYAANGYGSVPYNSKKFNDWVLQGTAPGFDASLKLFKGLKKLGFTIILLTGRDEVQRSITTQNLLDAGYSGWEYLLLRDHKDQGKAAAQYKSERRLEMIKKGYKIHGNTGDQWSDLQGFAVADRSFKVPNPMYFIA